MNCSNTIDIHGPIERVYALGANIQDWPRLLPHYRYVRVEDSSEQIKFASMGAVRPVAGGCGIPVSWRARQELRPDERRILFEHVGGVTKGMAVEWRLEPIPGGVRVTIFHELTYRVPVLGPLFAEYIVGRFFVSHIAGKTLRCIKEMVEAEAHTAAGSS